jgi:hypothetical protein
MDPRPYIDDFDNFISILVRSQLTTQDHIESIVASFQRDYVPTSKYSNTITALCSFLTSCGLLTSWQCGRLRRGQYKGFSIDEFTLLDNMGQDRGEQCYLAREKTTGTLVRIAIRPLKMPTVPGVDYRTGDGFDYRFVETMIE